MHSKNDHHAQVKARVSCASDNPIEQHRSQRGDCHQRQSGARKPGCEASVCPHGSGFKEARPFLGICLLLAIGAYSVHPLATLLPLVAAGYILYFFRDPERKPPSDPLVIVSAADGRVISVDECEEVRFGLGRMKRIAIFLSVFDVHVNRAPWTGRVLKMLYQPGRFLDARKKEVERQNESLSWLIETARGPIVMRQIAGLIARRIVAWRGENYFVSRGQRVGMIRFGSRTDIYLPIECEALVQPGQRVQGGATPIARWPATVEVHAHSFK